MPAGTQPVDVAFVGRIAELDTVSRVRRSGGRSIVIAGASGVGKTWLARAAADAAAADGWNVDWAFGTEAARDLPLGAFLHLVPSGEVARGDALLGAIADVLLAQEQGQRTMLIVDDAHLLDPASATLVHRIASTDRAFVVLTIRSGEPVVDAIRALWRDDADGRIELLPFDEAETATLAEAVLGAAVDGPTRRLLWSATRGNALFARELMSEGVRRSHLAKEGDLWHWRGELVTSPQLRDLVRARVERVEPGARIALEMVAVCEPIGFALVQQMLEPGGLAAAEEHDLVEVVVDGSRRFVRCAHPLYGEVVRGELATDAADNIRRSFADALERAGARRSDDLLRLVRLRLDAGAPIEPVALKRGARQAAVVGDLDLLERIADTLTRAGPDPEIEFMLGGVAADRGRYDEALDRWERLSMTAVDDELCTQIAKSRATVLAHTFNRTADAVDVLEAARDRVASEDLREVLAAARLFIARIPPPESDFGAGPQSDESTVLMWLAHTQTRSMSGRFDDVLDDPTPIDDIAARVASEWPLGLVFVRMMRCHALHFSGRFDAGVLMARDNLDEAIRANRLEVVAGWLHARATQALVRGRPGDAAALQEDAVVISRENDTGQLRTNLCLLAYVYAQTGKLDDARAALDEAKASRPTSLPGWVTERRAQAAITASEGSLRAAVAMLVDDAAAAAENEWWFFELYARLDAARYGDARTQAARVDELAGQMQGPLPPALAEFVRALAADDTDALLRAAQTLERAGSMLHAAEAATAAARAAGSAGRKDAYAIADRAAALAAAAGQPGTPLLAGGVPSAPLTTREREVAMLAANGRSDREIAAVLGVSVRTVHAHLRRIYARLGIAGRAELPGILGTPRTVVGPPD